MSSKEQQQNNNDETLSERAKEKVYGWATSTTTHGVQRFTKATRRHTRLLWLVFILIALGLAIYVLANDVLQYLQHDVTTKIRIVDEKSVTFPVVSVCNMNPLVTPSAGQYIKEYFEQK